VKSKIVYGRYKPLNTNVPENWKHWLNTFIKFERHGDNLAVSEEWLSRQRGKGLPLPPFRVLNKKDVETI